MSGTPHNMSPHVSCRSVRIYGSSMPSTRNHEDHHRSSSDLNLLELNSGARTIPSPRQLAHVTTGAPVHHRSRSGSESGESPFSLRMDRKLSVGDDFDAADIDSVKGKGGVSTWSEDKQLAHAAPESSDSEDEGRASPVERSAANSPVNLAGSEQQGKGAKTIGRLLIVANRLPLSMKVTKKPAADGSGKDVNEMTFSSSSGGLVSALAGCEMESRWIGWPGAEVKRVADRESVRTKLAAQNCVPVFLTQKVCDPFYNGFCNNLLWPLFHYIPLPVEAITTADEQFEAYKVANQVFADSVLRTYQAGDVVWIHDYHLMLLPRILRQKHPKIKIGFFFHTPFPAFEIYRMMPAREELLAGVLSSDLIGFHTPDYQRHFQDSCVRILGAEAKGDLVTYNGFTSRLGAFPIGIDPKRFISTCESEGIKSIMEQYRKDFAGKKVLLGIDRLDYIKGIQHKIYALERLFQKHPKLAQEVVFVQIAVPSRTDVVEYKKLSSSTHKLVGRVNGIYGGVGSSPIHYLDQSIPFDRMCALYRVADAMLITSIRDGMNLVAYEYIACQKEMAGVLVLSEFAGAAQSLGNAPLEINPWSISSTSDALFSALTMPEAERKQRMASMFAHVTTNTASAWAKKFLTATLIATNTPLSYLKDLGFAEEEEPAAPSDDWRAASKAAPAAAIKPTASKPAAAAAAAAAQ